MDVRDLAARARTRPPLRPVLPLSRLPDGVLHAALPTPFPVDAVNCWLLTGAPVTLVDPGVFTANSLAAVDALLAGARLRIDNVEQIVVTHAHADHFGAAWHLADRAGASLVCSRGELGKLLADHRIAPTFARVLDELGVPPAARPVIGGGSSLVRRPPSDAVTIVDDGDTIVAGGRSFRAVVTPGHAAGHLSLWDGATLLSGDHLLPRIIPATLLETDPLTERRRPSLAEYLAGLERILALAPQAILPGHGEAFADAEAVGERIRRYHEARLAIVRASLRDGGHGSAWDLQRRLFPTLEGPATLGAVAQVVGHLDLLVAAGSAAVDTTVVPHRYST